MEQGRAVFIWLLPRLPSESTDCDATCVYDCIELGQCRFGALAGFCVFGAGADCNENLVTDSCDIEAGTSADGNENGIADDLEVVLVPENDCNANGQPDECDLGLDPYVTDCDWKLVPDECDLAADRPYDGPRPCDWFAKGADPAWESELDAMYAMDEWIAGYDFSDMPWWEVGYLIKQTLMELGIRHW